MCLVPRDVGPNNIPNISDAVSVERVGIGTGVLLGRGTVRCAKTRGPPTCGIIPIGGGRSKELRIVARPDQKTYAMK
jgi:hypothetical protein